MLNIEIWGFVIGVAGALFAVYAYVKQKVKKSASYRVYRYILLGGAEGILPSEVVIHFQDKRINHLKKKTVIFWNSGTETIDKNDIVRTDPLRVLFTGKADILKSSIVRQSKTTNNATILKPTDLNATYSHDPTKREVYFGFEYLDPGQGLELEILYQGDDDFEVMGTIKGIPEGLSDTIELESVQRRRFRLISKIFVLFLSVAIAASLSIIVLEERLSAWFTIDAYYNIYYILIAINSAMLLWTFLYVFLYDFIVSRYLGLRIMPPKDLRT
jgi:hypothetical protein